MKTGVEAGHLRHIRQTTHGGFDGGEVVRLMQGGEWNQLPELLQHLGVQYSWNFETRASVDHAMSNAKNTRAAIFRSEPRRQGINSLTSITHICILVGECLTVAVLHGQARRHANAFDLPARFEAPALTVRTLKHREFQARRSGIEHKGIVVHRKTS